MARILIVEDEKNAREALREVFSVLHEVRLAEHVSEARAVLKRESVDPVLTDGVWPGEEDGLDLLGHVTRKEGPRRSSLNATKTLVGGGTTKWGMIGGSPVL